MAVSYRRALGVVAALGAAHGGHIGFHDRGHHLQPGSDRKGEQALAHLTSQLAQRHARPPDGGIDIFVGSRMRASISTCASPAT